MAKSRRQSPDEPRKDLPIAVTPWTVNVLEIFDRDIEHLLTASQQDHLWDVIRDVAREDDPLKCPTAEIVRVTLPSGSRVCVLRDRNGILKKLHLQVFFDMLRESRTLLFLGACNYSHDRKLPYSIALSIETRLIRFREMLTPPHPTVRQFGV